LKGSSGLVICVGLNKDGSYVAFDGNCYHMGEPLFDGCGAGDIEDDGSVRCPAHGRRVCATTGACADRGPLPSGRIGRACDRRQRASPSTST
jgi:nitrite reductase/ring-hydroxylating ferredoxin subunit